MIKKIVLIFVVFLFFNLIACQEIPNNSFLRFTPTPTPTFTPTFTLTPTVTLTPTFTFTPSPTSTRIILSRVIPKDYYNLVTIKYTSFRDGKAENICFFKNSHKAIKKQSDEVIEIAEQVDIQKVLGTCPPIPESKNFKLNVFTGEVVKSEDSSDTTAYYGKNYQGSDSVIFSIPSTPISVWKIIEPYNRTNFLGIVLYSGSQEQLIDKATGILVYRKTEYHHTEDPKVTFLIETVSMRTNAPIGGLQNGVEFTYSIDQ